MTQERLSALDLISRHAPVSITALADLERVRPPTMSRMTAYLAETGLLARRDHKTDGRGVLVSLTAKGRRVLERARAEFARQAHDLIGDPSPEQISALKALAEALDGAASETDPGSRKSSKAMGAASRDGRANRDARGARDDPDDVAKRYLTEGRAALLSRQLTLRFGPLADAARERIAAAPIEQLDEIAERLLTAPTLDDALGAG
jgi:DNA-binding MarR family transcriptional regulator